YFWALSRDDRPWAGPDPPCVVYAYAPGRGAVHGLRLLEGYRGQPELAPAQPPARSSQAGASDATSRRRASRTGRPHATLGSW
ncbi:hypothetical protein FNJ47_47900, partial [Bradyrhizobium sp. UFLA 03-164]|nr:hypothetical protein [Bradyrhizobium uaiense]